MKSMMKKLHTNDSCMEEKSNEKKIILVTGMCVCEIYIYIYMCVPLLVRSVVFVIGKINVHVCV